MISTNKETLTRLEENPQKENPSRNKRKRERLTV
jgi:hypothetical protein